MKFIKKYLVDFRKRFSFYPDLNLYKRRIRNQNYMNRNLSYFDEFIDLLRRKFWTFIAKRNKKFKCCFYRNFKKSTEPKFKHLQEKGFVEIGNFLKNDDFEILKSDIKEKYEILKGKYIG